MINRKRAISIEPEELARGMMAHRKAVKLVKQVVSPQELTNASTKWRLDLDKKLAAPKEGFPKMNVVYDDPLRANIEIGLKNLRADHNKYYAKEAYDRMLKEEEEKEKKEKMAFPKMKVTYDKPIKRTSDREVMRARQRMLIDHKRAEYMREKEGTERRMSAWSNMVENAKKIQKENAEKNKKIPEKMRELTSEYEFDPVKSKAKKQELMAGWQRAIEEREAQERKEYEKEEAKKKSKKRSKKNDSMRKRNEKEQRKPKKEEPKKEVKMNEEIMKRFNATKKSKSKSQREYEKRKEQERKKKEALIRSIRKRLERAEKEEKKAEAALAKVKAMNDSKMKVAEEALANAKAVTKSIREELEAAILAESK